MILSDSSQIQQLCINKVGNKYNDDGVYMSKSLINIDDGNIDKVLIKYFLSSFVNDEYYNLHHESDNKLNEVFSYVTEIFEHPSSLLINSVHLAKHLYEQSTHPKIKPGEFYVAYFKDCQVGGEMLDAVGLFKSENKDVFLKVQTMEGDFEVDSEEGININKLDKGCLIFNTEKDAGYLVAIVDNSGKGYEAQYWKDDFLHVSPRNDDYHQTQNALSLCKNFVVEKFSDSFEVSRADQVDMLNKSVQFFKENDRFKLDDFAAEVIRQPEVIAVFNDYKKQFSDDRDIDIYNEFNISPEAVKKQQRIFKSIIKLDKNFHIYIHGNKELIEKGYDEEKKMSFYKVFFKEES